MIDVLVQHHFNTHISRPLLTGNQRKYKVNRRGDVIKDKSGKKILISRQEEKDVWTLNLIFVMRSELEIYPE